MIYLQLFLSFLQIGAFSFGGGYAAMPLIQNQVVTIHGWLTLEKFADLVIIAEMTPGPIAVNSATFVGTQIAGFPGAIVATAGCILPSCIFVTTLTYIYMRFRNMDILQGILGSLRPAVVAMIANAGLTILISTFFVENVVSFQMSNIKVISIFLFVFALYLLRKKKMNPILVMLLCGIIELVVQTIERF